MVMRASDRRASAVDPEADLRLNFAEQPLLADYDPMLIA